MVRSVPPEVLQPLLVFFRVPVPEAGSLTGSYLRMRLSDDTTVASIVLPSLLDFPPSLGDDILPTHLALASERVSAPRLFRCLDIPFAMVPWASQLFHVHVPSIEELWCGCDPTNFCIPYHKMPVGDLDYAVEAGLMVAGISFSSTGLLNDRMA